MLDRCLPFPRTASTSLSISRLLSPRICGDHVCSALEMLEGRKIAGHQCQLLLNSKHKFMPLTSRSDQ
jgi:hypothetical protein